VKGKAKGGEHTKRAGTTTPPLGHIKRWNTKAVKHKSKGKNLDKLKKKKNNGGGRGGRGENSSIKKGFRLIQETTYRGGKEKEGIYKR